MLCLKQHFRYCHAMPQSMMPPCCTLRNIPSSQGNNWGKKCSLVLILIHSGILTSSFKCSSSSSQWNMAVSKWSHPWLREYLPLSRYILINLTTPCQMNMDISTTVQVHIPPPKCLDTSAFENLVFSEFELLPYYYIYPCCLIPWSIHQLKYQQYYLLNAGSNYVIKNG